MQRMLLMVLIALFINACQSTPPPTTTDTLTVSDNACSTDCDHAVVAMTVRDNMFFSRDTMTVEAGQLLSIDFTNTSRLPHNIVIVAGDMAVATEVNRNAINQDDYMPQHPAVIAALPITMPNQTGNLTWQPSQPGTYVYLCTYPGHFDAGMYGTITIK